MKIQFESKEQKQKVVDKIGKDKDIRNYVQGKLFLIIVLYLIAIIHFISLAIEDFSIKSSSGLASDITFIVLFFISLIENIVEFNKLEKTKK